MRVISACAATKCAQKLNTTQVCVCSLSDKLWPRVWPLWLHTNNMKQRDEKGEEVVKGFFFFKKKKVMWKSKSSVGTEKEKGKSRAWEDD